MSDDRVTYPPQRWDVHPAQQSLADRIDAIRADYAAMSAQVAEIQQWLGELLSARRPEPRGIAALAETERKLSRDLAAMAQEFDPPEDHQGSRQVPPTPPRPYSVRLKDCAEVLPVSRRHAAGALRQLRSGY